MHKTILISGSIAYDFIMEYDGVFQDALLADHLHDLNIAFTATTRTMFFGGCAPNIAYGMTLLGENPFIYGVAGTDFDRYEQQLRAYELTTRYIGRSTTTLTASAQILTDKNDNQITIFAPGAMNDLSCDKQLAHKDYSLIERAILSPDTCKRTISLAKELTANHIPYIFDPGQMTPAFDAQDLRKLITHAEGLIANSYEVRLIQKTLAVTKKQLADMVSFFIETKGKQGSMLHQSDITTTIPAVKPAKIKDPTGCGDAFRSGLLVGLLRNYSYEKACKLGSLVAAYAIEYTGTQQYRFTTKNFNQRFEATFGETI